MTRQKYLFDQRKLAGQKPKIKLAIVFGFLLVSFVGSMLTFSTFTGAKVSSEGTSFEKFLSLFTFSGVVLGVIFQLGITYVQYAFCDEKKSPQYIFVTAISTVANVFGYWSAMVALLTFLFAAASVAAAKTIKFLAFLMLLGISLFSDIYPEHQLVGKNNG